MVQMTTPNTRFVNPTQGQDTAFNQPSQPYKTLTFALQTVPAGTLIQLAPGTYSAATGERFPLVIGAGIVVMGTEANQGEQVILSGSGIFTSPSFGNQAVTVLLAGSGELRGVTVTNPNEVGTGVWIESGSPIVYRCRLLRCRRDGVFVTGNALPLIQANEFLENGASAVSLFRNAKGELRQNRCRQSGYAIAVSDQSAPLIIGNQLLENSVGIVLSRSAQPVLRENRIESNQEDGLRLQDSALPDLGTALDLGGNTLRNNGRYDLNNQTSQAVTSIGNWLVPSRLQGAVILGGSQVPDPVAVPPPLIGQVIPTPLPHVEAPSGDPPSDTDSGAIAPLQSQFVDMRGHWAAGFVEVLAQQGLVRGFWDNTFKPDAAVTRAQFAALAVASFPDLPVQVTTSTRFEDLPTDFWAYAAITKARSQGMISGFPDNTVRPNDTMSRIQAIVALANGLGLTGGRAGDLGIYRDRAQIPSYAVDALAAGTRSRLVVNYPDVLQLRPMEAITRAELAALVYQGRVIQGKAEVLESPYIVRPDTTQPLFSDVQSHWAVDFITALANRNLIRGFSDGQFQPDAPMTRAQFAALVVNAFDPPSIRSPMAFRDVPANFWAASAIATAYQAGFVAGFPDLTFGPEQNILRVQILVALVNGLNLLAGVSLNPSLLNLYTDAAVIPVYAQDAITKATRLGLVVNYPIVAELHPNRIATRAEVSAMVYQALVVQKHAIAIASPYLVTSG